MSRTTRYQAAIMRGEEILLIKHQEHNHGRAYWLLPGGGIEEGETETECVQREVREETGLEIKVQGLLLNEVLQHKDEGPYQRFKTYLCHPITDNASPGYEPEPGASAIYAIVEVGWFSITDETTWNELIRKDTITRSVLQKVRKALEDRKKSSIENELQN